VFDFPAPGVAMGMYNLTHRSATSPACFNTAWPRLAVYLSTKNTILKAYDAASRISSQEISDKEYKAQFAAVV
jgi:isocitrate dehydrogenase